MHYTIRQISPTKWALVAADGTIVGTYDDDVTQTGYDRALSALSTLIGGALAADGPGGDATGDGLLPEVWASDAGIAFSEQLPGGRDFTNCTWTWRDPVTCLVPLMFQTETEYGHMGAELAGFVEAFRLDGGTVHGTGRFYDSDIGQAARDVLLGDRRFGVSVDPSEAVDVDEHFECTDWDDEGFCQGGDYTVAFLAYEIAGLTMTPFPGFANASIMLDGAAEPASTRPVRAAVSIPDAPPREWFTIPEPVAGVQFIDGRDGDALLTEQLNADGIVAGHAVPLTIRDDGLVYGHLTWWGQCHIAEPWGQGVCASAGLSRNGYADFHTGTVRCADGTDVPTGVLTVGCEHSSAMDVRGVRDHLAHAGMGWASVRVVDGEHGPWLCGALRPDLTEAQVQVLRRLSLSGEWVGELAGILAVNAPGLPVQRALAASAFADRPSIGAAGGQIVPFTIPAPALRSSARGGTLAKLVGGNIIRRCAECEQRRLARGGAGPDDLLGEIRAVRQLVSHVERRTRHLIGPEAEATRASLQT